MSTDSYFKDLQKLKYQDESSLVQNLIETNSWMNNPSIYENAELIVSKCRKDRNKNRTVTQL